jgi:hypothetical protein
MILLCNRKVKVHIYCRDFSWKDICEVKSYPWHDEIKQYLNWKLDNSKMNRLRNKLRIK